MVKERTCSVLNWQLIWPTGPLLSSGVLGKPGQVGRDAHCNSSRITPLTLLETDERGIHASLRIGISALLACDIIHEVYRHWQRQPFVLGSGVSWAIPELQCAFLNQPGQASLALLSLGGELWSHQLPVYHTTCSLLHHVSECIYAFLINK